MICLLSKTALLFLQPAARSSQRGVDDGRGVAQRSAALRAPRRPPRDRQSCPRRSDSVSKVGLAGIAQVLDGGAPAFLPGDVLLVADVAYPRLSPVLIAGAAPITHQNFEFEEAAGVVVALPAFGTVGAGLLAAMLVMFGFAALRSRTSGRV